MQHYVVTNRSDHTFFFSKDDQHHLLHVMRMKRGDEVICMFERKQYHCTLEIESANVSARIVKELEDYNELSAAITLIYAMPKGDKFELVLQKATELGVNRIVPFLSERSLVRLDHNQAEKKMERWQKIIKEASEQSRRNLTPELVTPIMMKQIPSYLSEVNLTGDETKAQEGTGKLLSYFSKLLPSSVTVLVGPEGGFSPQEFAYFESIGFTGVSFGKRILRSETAAIYILSCLALLCEEVRKGD